MAALPKGLKSLNFAYCDAITNQGDPRASFLLLASSIIDDVIAGYMHIPDSIETLLLGGKPTNLGLSYLSNKKFLRKLEISFLDLITNDGLRNLPPSILDLDLVCA
jgi:hypothetical protein